MKRWVLSSVFLLYLSMGLYSQDLVQRLELYNALNGVVQIWDATPEEGVHAEVEDSVYGTSLIRYSLQSPRNSIVRGVVRLGLLLDIAMGGLHTQLLLERAYIRARIPLGETYVSQLELGLNTLSFGEGQVYNAGDVVFGAGAFSLQNLSGEYRDNPLWNLRVYAPLGTLSFVEAVMHYPSLRVSKTPLISNKENAFATTTSSYEFPQADEVEFSTRLGLNFDVLEFELGSNYALRPQYLTPYMSVNIPSVVNMYLSASSRIYMPVGVNNQQFATVVYETAAISLGISSLFGVSVGDTVDLVAEALYTFETISFFLGSSWVYSSRFSLATQLLFAIKILDIQYAQSSSMLVQTGPRWSLFDGFVIALQPSVGYEYGEHLSKNSMSSDGKSGVNSTQYVIQAKLSLEYTY